MDIKQQATVALLASLRLRKPWYGFSLLFLFALWLIAKPYNGIIHDSILYTAQALKRLHPAAFSQDIFFRFGSQDDFTFFPSLYAWTIRLFGINLANWGLTLSGKLLWFAGLVYFTRAALPRTLTLCALAGGLMLFPYYDAFGVFSSGESFLTARLFAEAGGLFALGACLRRAYPLAFGMLGGTLLLHPLMGLPVVAYFFVCDWARHRTPMLIIGFCGLLATFTLAWFGFPLFNLLTHQIDPQWFELLQTRCIDIFLENWAPEDAGYLLQPLAIGWLARQHLPRRLKGLATGLLWLPPSLAAVSWLGSSVLHSVLLTQLQLWRVFWLSTYIALPLFCRLWLTGWGRSRVGQQTLLVMLCAILVQGASGSILAWLAVIGAQLSKKLNDGQIDFPVASCKRLYWLTCALLCTFTVVVVVANLDLAYQEKAWDSLPGFLGVISSPLGALAGLWLLHQHNRSVLWQIPVYVLLLGSLVYATLAWTPGARIAKENSPGFSGQTLIELQQRIPEKAVIYWPANLKSSWFWLQRAFYASSTQSAGWVFSRATAIEGKRRLDLLWQAGFEDANPYFLSSKNPNPPQQTLLTSAVMLCMDPELDFLIFPNQELPGKVFTFGGHQQNNLALIDCAVVRATDPATM